MNPYLPLSLRLLIWLTSSLFVLGLAYLLQRLVRTDRYSINAISFVFLVIFVMTLFVVLMGLMGILAPIPMLLISVVGILTMIAIPRSRRAMLALPADSRALQNALGFWWKDLPVWLRWLTATALIASVLRFIFLIWTLPPFVWDSLTYHLTNVAHWTQTGSIELFETSMARIYTPANFEALAAWFTVFIHHDAVVEAAGIPAYILAILAVYAGIRGFGIGRSSAWMGAMAYASMPALLLATTGTKNDPHVAAYYLAAMAVLINLAITHETGKSKNPAGQILLLGLILLVAAGTKAYIAHLLPGLLIVAWLTARQSGGLAHWGRVFRGALYQLRRNRGIALAGIGILILGIFIGSFWNVRNWALTGNPFYPYGVDVEGQQVLDGTGRDADLSSSWLIGNLESLVDKFGDKQARISPDLPNTTGWGWFASTLGLAALVWALIRSSKVRYLAIGFSVSLLLIFTSTHPGPWNMRYMIWFPALFSYAFAVFADRVLVSGTFPAKAIFALFAMSLALNFAAALTYGRINVEHFMEMLSLPLANRSAAALRVNVPVEYENTLEIVPRDAVLGYDLSNNGFIYPLYRADLSQALVYVRVPLDETCEDLALSMEKSGTRFLFVAPEHTNDEVLAFVRNCAESDTVIRERTRGLYVVKRDQ